MGRNDNFLDDYVMAPLVAKDIPMHSALALLEAVGKRARDDYVNALSNAAIGYPDRSQRSRSAKLRSDIRTIGEVEHWLSILGLKENEIERFKKNCEAEAEKRSNAWAASAPARDELVEHWTSVLYFESEHPGWKNDPVLKAERRNIDKKRRKKIKELAETYNIDPADLRNVSVYARRLARRKIMSP